MKYLFILASLISYSAFAQVDPCETGPGNNCIGARLVCEANYSSADTDESFEFEEPLKHESPEAIYISATKTVKSKDGRFELLGHASLYQEDFFNTAVEIYDHKTGLTSSAFSLAHDKQFKAEVFLTEGKAPNITTTASIECTVKQ